MSRPYKLLSSLRGNFLLMRRSIVMVLRVAPKDSVVLLTVITLAAIAPLGVAWATKFVLDAVVGGVIDNSIYWAAMALGFATVSAPVLAHLEKFTVANIGRRTKAHSQLEMFSVMNRKLEGIATLESPDFQDKVNLAQQGGSASPVAILSSTGQFFGAFSTLLGFALSIYIISPSLALLVLLLALPALRMEFSLARKRATYQWKLENSDRRQFFYSALLTSPVAAKEVRLLNLGSYFKNLMLSELAFDNGLNKDLDRKELRMQVSFTAVCAVLGGYGMWICVDGVVTGGLSIGDLTIFLAAIMGMTMCISSMIRGLGTAYNALIMFRHYEDVLSLKSELESPALARLRVSPLGMTDGIRFENVWFRYSPDLPWVLRGVNLNIVAGKNTAVVGVNGAGKSTIVKLVMRLYEPTEGKITWDGVDLKDLRPEDLRNEIGSVFQDFMEYDITVKENIKIGDVNSPNSEDYATRAAENANADVFIRKLPRGYDTLLTRLFQDQTDRLDSSTGVLLSGGQGQRLALARAYMRVDRPFWVLDEPTAGLDPHAEFEMHSNLLKRRKGKANLLISHRLNTIKDSDSIVVLDGGVVCEEGTHSHLVSQSGVYAGLFAKQAKGYLDG